MTEPPLDPKWAPPGGWTLDTLHHHVMTLMNEREKRLDERFGAQEKAAERLAEELTAYKFQSNEWRGALNDNSIKLLTRSEYEANHSNIVNRVEQLITVVGKISDRLIPIESRTGHLNIGLLVSAVAILVGLVALAHPFLH